MLKKILKISLIIVFCVFFVKFNYALSTSSNNLKSLVLDQQGLSPNFDKNKLNYSIFVTSDVANIGIDAITEDVDSKVTITGNENLKIGDNNVEIKVTSKNKETKTYNIMVTKTDEKEKSDSYLQTLILENIELSPLFEPEILEYDGGNISSDIEKILLFAAPNQPNAKLDIIGNENFKTGENYITIKVTSEDNLTKKEYKVKITKSNNKKTEDLQRESIENFVKDNSITSDNTSINNNFKITNEKIIIIVLIVIIIILLILLFKNKRKK